MARRRFGSSFESNNPQTGFYLSQEGLSIGSKVKINADGVMYIGSNAVKEGGKSGKNPNCWTINGNTNQSYITYKGGSQFRAATSKPDDNGKIYLGTDGIFLGGYFSVDKNGKLISKSGTIGGWTIDSTALYKNNLVISSNGTIDVIKDRGTSKAQIQWQLKYNGDAILNQATIKGTVTATSGSIGGWIIKDKTLRSSSSNIILDAENSQIKIGSNITLNANDQQIKVGNITIGFTKQGSGSITSKESGKNGWSIDGEGNAIFN